MFEPPLDRYRTKGSVTTSIVTYLLHLQFPAGSCLHYVGSTKRAEFRRRMRSHASGYGTSRTAVHFNAGAEFWLVKQWFSDDRTLEKLLLKQPDLSPYCAICSPRLPLPGADVAKTFRLDGAPRPVRSSLDLFAEPTNGANG